MLSLCYSTSTKSRLNHMLSKYPAYCTENNEWKNWTLHDTILNLPWYCSYVVNNKDKFKLIDILK